ncbi:hypothetical protein BC567DRAFT_238357 [Phyllosticta citribraziliensis]
MSRKIPTLLVLHMFSWIGWCAFASFAAAAAVGSITAAWIAAPYFPFVHIHRSVHRHRPGATSQSSDNFSVLVSEWVIAQTLSSVQTIVLTWFCSVLSVTSTSPASPSRTRRRAAASQLRAGVTDRQLRHTNASFTKCRVDTGGSGKKRAGQRLERRGCSVAGVPSHGVLILCTCGCLGLFSFLVAFPFSFPFSLFPFASLLSFAFLFLAQPPERAIERRTCACARDG